MHYDEVRTQEDGNGKEEEDSIFSFPEMRPHRYAGSRRVCGVSKSFSRWNTNQEGRVVENYLGSVFVYKGNYLCSLARVGC